MCLADFNCTSVKDHLELLPSIFFSCANLEKLIPLEKFRHSELLIYHANISFLEELRFVAYDKLWLEASENTKKNIFKEVSCPEFESQDVNRKVSAIMELVQHLTNCSCTKNANQSDYFRLRGSVESCAQSGCTEILDVCLFESEVVSILLAVLNSLPYLRFLPAFIFGYATHSINPNFNLTQRIIRNFPNEWFSIWYPVSNSRILHHILNSDEFSKCAYIEQTDCANFLQSQKNARQLAVLRLECVIRSLLLVKPIHAQLVMEHCIVNRIFPGLILDLILWLHEEGKMSLFLLLKRLLLDSGPETRSWICDYLKHKSDHLRKLDHHLIETTKSFVPNDTSVPLSDDVILKALTLLRVLTALRGFVNYTFSPELSSRLLELLTHRTCVSERGSQYITYALAFLIGLRSSLSHSQDIANRSDFPADTERIIVTWLQRLIDQQDSFQSISLSSSVTDLPDPLNTSVSVSKPYVESLLLLAILFHTNQPGPITELISNLLGLRIPSLGRTVNGWRKVFLNSVFTETMIANQAARIPITRGLNRRLGSHLPIQCVLQLLKSHAFAKNKLHIKEWIVGQLCESVRPLHPLLPDLIEAHVIHAFGATPNTLPPADSSFHSPGLLTALISESDLIAQFGRTDQLAIARMCVPTPADGDLAKHGDFDYPPQARAPSSAQIDLTPALLFLYYVLFVYDYQLTLRISTNRHRLPGEPACVYSDKLWQCIPTTYLLQHARAHLSDYSSLYPRLLQLVTNHLPHLTVGELIIQDELLLDPMWSAETDSNEAETLALFDSNGSVPTVCSPEQLDAAFLAVHAHLDDTTVRAQSRWSVLDSDAHRAVRHLVSSVHNLACLVRALHVDRLVPYGAVLGQRVPSLLLHTANTIFSGNQRFIRLLEYLWRRLHMVMPRRLGVLTINSLIESRYGGSPAQVSADIFSGGLRRQKALTNEDLYIDPVENVMNSVDSRVFRCPSLLRILLRILESNLLASRSHWTHRLVERIVIPPSAGNRSTATAGSASATSTTANSVTLTHLPSGPVRTGAGSSVVAATNGSDTLSDGPATAQSGNSQTTGTTLSDEECERLCSTMLLTQNATVVHLLLEHCLPTEAERDRASEITVLREVRNIICTYIHYMFIAEPALADVIVWQTYPRSLLAVSAQAIPSLHICLDSVVNVFRLSGDYAKMIFCLDLVSHLSLHYNIQSALERAAFMIDSFYHILTAVVSTDERPDLFQACLPALVRLGEAFPSLAPVIVRLILAVGAQIGNILPEATRTALRLSLLGDRDSDLIEWTDETLALPLRERSAICLRQAMITFDKIVRRSSAQRFLYYPPEWASA